MKRKFLILLCTLWFTQTHGNFETLVKNFWAESSLPVKALTITSALTSAFCLYNLYETVKIYTIFNTSLKQTDRYKQDLKLHLEETAAAGILSSTFFLYALALHALEKRFKF
jgi:hypothetical protein